MKYIYIPRVSPLIRRQSLCMSSIDSDLTVYEQLLTTEIKIIKEIKSHEKNSQTNPNIH